MRILFVCLGNICRSPAAEGVLRHVLRQRGLDGEIEVDSAGTGSWHVGERADPRMREAASRRGYDLTSRGRQVTPDDLDAFDLIVAMDRDNLDGVRRLGSGSADVKLLSDYLDDSYPDEVPDPYYGGDRGFETVLDMLEAAMEEILAENGF